MAQIQSPETYVDGQQVTATRLNNQTNGAIVLPGVITDQTPIAASTVAVGDTLLIHDASVAELRSATAGDLFGSGFPIVTNTVTATASNDIIVTPYDGSSVVGSNYVSADGLTVTVTTLASHGLSVNNVILVSGAGSGYNGTFRITSVTLTTFQYVMYTAATPTPSPTACTFVRKASEIVNGNEVVTGNQFVNGKIEAQTLQINGQADITTAAIKTANITTAIQYNGTPIFSLASVDETAIPFDQANATTEPLRVSTCNQWRVITSLTSQTKTDKEVWVIEADFPLVYYPWAGATKFSVHRLSTNTNLALEIRLLQNAGAAYVSYMNEQVKMKCVIPAGVTFTAETLQLRFRYNATFAIAGAIANVGYGGSLTDPDITKTLRVTKYIKP
jgi:hypothetical protein